MLTKTDLQLGGFILAPLSWKSVKFLIFDVFEGKMEQVFLSFSDHLHLFKCFIYFHFSWQLPVSYPRHIEENHFLIPDVTSNEKLVFFFFILI